MSAPASTASARGHLSASATLATSAVSVLLSAPSISASANASGSDPTAASATLRATAGRSLTRSPISPSASRAIRR